MSECYTTFTVSRYGWYPSDTPTGVCVGFTGKCTPNERSTYTDTIVASSSAVGKTDDEIVTLAWNTLSGSLLPWAESEMEKPTLMGEVYKTVSGSA